MGLFTYQIIDRTGNTVRGQMEADHEWTAAAHLRKMGYTVVDVNPVRESSFRQAFQVRRRVGVGDLSLFSRQLAAMLDAGIPLTRCLFTLGRQTSNPALARAASEAARNVEAGMSFSESLRAHPEIFPSLYVSMVRAGEVGGTLEEMLRRLSEQLERDKGLRDNVRSATFYPTVVICFATLVVLGMMFFIVPIFTRFFPPGVELPLPTRVLMAVSDSLRHYWYLWFLAAAAAVLGLCFYLRSPSGRRSWDRVKFKLPVLGSLFQRAVVARFARTLATLLSGGIPVLQALEAAGPATGSTVVAEAVQEAGEKIQEGKSIAGPLEESGVFPPMVIQMVSVGEETGSLSFLLTRIAEFYEAEVATITRGLTALIEPVLIIFVGCIIGVIVVSMYLPIFTVVTTVGR
ncbi:MAG: type II secretion system F family protein [Thermoanaerobacterales bacterium]|nr:type II secretion system F family protein [Thermoanaerobacterales bacterium]